MEKKRGIFRKLLLVLVAGLFAFTGLVFSSGGLAFAKTIDGIYGVKLNYNSSIYEISYLKYSVDGIIVEYNKAGFSEAVGTQYETNPSYKMTFSGESGALGLMKGEARVEYSDTEPFASTLSEYNLTYLNLPRSSYNYTEEQLSKARIPVDKNTDLEVRFSYLTEVVYDIYYLTNFSYKQGEYGNTFRVDETTLDRLGNVNFVNGEYNEESKTYSRTINLNYAFEYANSFASGLYFKAKNIFADMIYTFNTDQKVQSIDFVGSGADIGSSGKYFSYTSVADIKLSPNAGTIVKKTDLYIGDDLKFSVYGGVYTNGKYEFLSDSEDRVVTSYGNFAVAVESDYEFEAISSGKGNYAKLSCYTESGQELYSVTIDDSGEIHLYVTEIYAWIKVDITTMKYAQLDLKLVDGNSGTFSGEPFRKVSFSYDGKVITYEYVEGVSEIASRYFVLDFSDTLEISVSTKAGYNFDSTVNPLLVTGDTYLNPSFSGGLVTISARNEDVYSVTVALYYNGDLFKDMNTKIYFSTGDITSPSEFAVSAGGADGMATISGLLNGTVLKFRVDISRYYMLTINGNTYTKTYCDFNYVVNGNSNVILVVSPISFERPVYAGDDTENKIGDIKINLSRVDSFSSNGTIKYRAVYGISYKPVNGIDFVPVTQENPSIFGMLLQSISVKNSSGVKVVIIKQINGTFAIEAEDSSVHEAIAGMCFNLTDNDGNKCFIVAEFTAKLSTFVFTLGNVNGEEILYNGSVYYGSNKIYLDKLVSVREWYQYFAGIKYSGREFLTNERIEPTLVTSGEFRGMYEYTLTNSWVLDGDGLMVDAIVDNRSFLVSYVFTWLEGGEIKHKTVSKYIKYGASFSVDTINDDNLKMPIIDANTSGSKFIGWNLEYDEDILYLDDAEGCNYTAHEVLTFNWDQEVRFIPVFSKSISLIEIKDVDGNIIHSVHVKYDTEVDENGVLRKDDEQITLSKFGYYFLGYYIEGSDVAFILYDGTNLTINYADLGKYIQEVGGVKKWIITENITLKAKFDAIEYTATVTINNEKYRDGDITISIGEINSIGSGKYLASGFTISDFVKIGGLKAKSNGFIAKVQISSYNVAGEFIDDVVSYIAYCTRHGIPTGEDYDGRFDLDLGEFGFLVSDFVSEGADWASLSIEITLEPIRYILSFETKAVNKDGKVINSLVGQTIYYYVTKDNASFDKLSSWLLCDEKGNILDPETYAWQNLMLGTLVFKESSLYGISGLKIEDNNGKVYSFKKWMDLQQNVEVSSALDVTYGFSFVSVFSDVPDITINYYSYFDVTKEYAKISTSGYFWSLNEDTGVYFVDPIKLANMYEIYLISGKLYYISGWSSAVMASIYDSVDASNLFALMQEYSVDYSTGNIEINFYAVYSLFKFEAVDNVDSVVIDVSLPNDVNGNGYDSRDVRFVVVDENDYNSYESSGYSDADIIAKILSTMDLIDSATVARGNTYNKSLSVPTGKKLFAVIQRKVDGVNINAFYIAIVISI